jgi:hypothetical protein
VGPRGLVLEQLGGGIARANVLGEGARHVGGDLVGRWCDERVLRHAVGLGAARQRGNPGMDAVAMPSSCNSTGMPSSIR